MNDKKKAADRPMGNGNRQYHLDTGPNDLAPRCLLVGSPERATMISDRYLHGVIVGDHRGLRSYTGEYEGQSVSVVTTGMGSGSAGIVIPEAVRSDGRVFIRVGSCATMWPEVPLGAAAICTGAVRFDGASDNWAPPGCPAICDDRVVTALVAAAKDLKLPHAVGIGATTTCFNEGQARPDDHGYIPQRLWDQFTELVARGVLFYSMEEATLAVWCSTHGGYPFGAIDSIYANRLTNAFEPQGDENTALIALHAIVRLDPEALFRDRPLRKPIFLSPHPPRPAVEPTN